MQKRRLDATPFLSSEETLELKIDAKSSKFNLVQAIICYISWLVVLAGDCFLIGMSSALKKSVDNVDAMLFPIVIILLVVHLVPFCFWLVHIMRNKKDGENKWYAITNKRILIISGTKTVNVTYVDLDEIDSFKLNKNSVTLSLGEEKIILGGIADPTPIVNKLSQIFDESRREDVEDKEAGEIKVELANSVKVSTEQEETGESENSNDDKN